MIVKAIVTDTSGSPLGGVEVTVTNDVNGFTNSRYTDGQGYADMYIPSSSGNMATVTTNGYTLNTQYFDAIGDEDTYHLNLVATPFKKPFKVAPRFWKANMCGIRVADLPPVAGGASDPTLVLSWFYDRYNAEDRAAIRACMKERNYTHWLLSWPDSRAIGQSPQQFRATCIELINDDFYPCAMLYSKDYDPTDFAGIMANIEPVLPQIVGLVPLMCVGWELSIALSPTTVQQLIDALCPLFTPAGTRCYVHFQEGYSSFPQPDQTFASFWNPNVGKLTGVLRQKILAQNHDQYRNDAGGICDVLTRFAGNFNVAHDSGFGHPFDDVELEITASFQFNGTMSEGEGDSWGDWALGTPPASGPAGLVSVMGSGNGCS